ncbi:MAG: hypothetical protein WDN26_21255 [Chitinophagaceae bacterium]
MRNQIQTSLNLTIVFLLIAVVGVAQKRHFGNYFNKWRYWGPMFVLKVDSTFEYKERTNAGTVTITEPAQYGTILRTTDSYVFSDSSYGTYGIINDTIFLNYATDEVKGDFNGYNIRPKKLYWKGKALCYIHPETGAVLRQKEYYMTWSKWKAPNLLKSDETYSQRIKLD